MRFLPIFVLCAFSPLVLGQPSDQGNKKKTLEELKAINERISKDPKDPDLYPLRAELHEKLARYDAAVADWDKVITLAPKIVSAYQQRGLARFKAGKIDESIADFDKYIELNPKAKISHWQRGISYYYAGRFDDGRKQFEGYQDFDSNDVENAVWRFMCMVRKNGIDKARKEILKIGDDRRVPMRQVYDLYKGDLKPADVLAAAKAGKPDPARLHRALFYAHLYVGIYYDLLGQTETAYEHLNKATEEHRVDHYMWDVARVHRDLLKKKVKRPK